MTRSSVILIGLDGLGWSEIDRWLTPQSLTNLHRLASDDTSCELRSTHPPWTPCAWPSLLSGRNPGKHGVFDFFRRDGYDKHLIDRSDVDAPYLFEIADAENRTPIVVNYPVTHPPSALENGAVVPGYLAQEETVFHPRHLKDEYEAKYGEYRIYPEYGADEDAVSEYVDVASHRRDMARFLDSRYEWDLLAVQFQVTDSVFHDFDDPENVRHVLEKVDEFVGDILDLGGDDPTVFLVSDHGMGDYEWTFYINSWLATHGYCETSAGETQYFRQQKKELQRDGDDHGDGTLSANAIEAVAGGFTRVGLSPHRIHRLLSTIGVADVVERFLPEDALVAAQNQVVDHAESEAFQLYFNSLGVHLNVEGRDPNGQIPRAEYEEVRATLINELERVRDPDGELVFEAVRSKEEVYDGDHLEDAPDIVLIPRDYRYDVSGSILDTFRRNPHKNHKPNGILLSNRELACDDEASIYDIAPSVAAALGIPVDTDTDGTVLLDAETAIERANWDTLVDGYADGRSNDEPSDVEERLANLGYME
ncbi:alkaline phosphatase family protein [Halopiger xanaduensis]|uniref:Type I phosphodiesterase/nucleotide pyrophosphatase n=1 Tax=Halopiger xanaduensis (strain DSM 18323 / JCM 14033 / SH-6) TaxID=797210 RepID=F8DD55_HALXS|nr:alkaline phosphatase family protein [Halopiger xanaduensis]AEH38942.1 type I phosphodiesterase/nucleotide pyrophosphatase [Halopiger xanaduensis SH-6]